MAAENRDTAKPAAVAFAPSGKHGIAGMRATVVGLVTPHLLRVVALADQAEKGMTVDWHLRETVTATMAELGDQYNAPALVASYVEGLEHAASQVPRVRAAYARALQIAIDTAHRLRRD